MMCKGQSKMSFMSLIVLCILISSTLSADVLRFPANFKLGSATAAYQVEGGWNASDKGESIWDRLLHNRPEIAKYENGDVACDSYHLWKRDIEMCQELGLDVYRFSISWPRLLPTGFPNVISEDGKNYYNNLIDGLLEKGIEPVVTIYHFDLPQSLQDLGGWTNPLISDWFADYSRVVYSLFADRVKIWLTINEPIGVCDFGFDRMLAPYFDDNRVAKYLCNKYVMIAHAKAWRIYDKEFKPRYNGKVSLTNLFIWFEPETPEDEELTRLTFQHWEGRYAHPIFSKQGGWPPELEKFLDEKSKKEGYHYPRLPPFTAEEIDLIKGTYDFYGLNHYMTRNVRKAKPGETKPWPFLGSQELGIVMDNVPTTIVTPFEWFTIQPLNLRKQLHWLNQTYGVSDVFITENGYVSIDKGLNDSERVKSISLFLEQVLLSIQDGLNVMGYIAWSLMDSLEWLNGYRINYGLYSVDFTDEKRTRTPRESARYFSMVTRTRRVYHKHLGLNYV